MRNNKRKGVRTLCTLADLKNRSVDDLRAHACILPSEVPLDMDKLLKAWKIIATSKDLSPLEAIAADAVAKNGEILGAVGAPNGNVVMLFSKNSSEREARFTVAHELAHCCLHTDKLSDGYIYFRLKQLLSQEEEDEANRFARDLLMPKEQLLKDISSITNSEPKGLPPEHLIHRLAVKYQVTERDMKEQLDSLVKDGALVGGL